MQQITGKTFDEERALYHLQDAAVTDCAFQGPADGESALKEAARIAVADCRFSLRYPLWHTRDFTLARCEMDEGTRAALWYARGGVITDTRIDGVKCLRECEDITLRRVTAHSPECGWKCRGVHMEDCDITSEYFLFETQNANLRHLHLSGKYSFQYTENLLVEDCELDTKDAFWHARHVTVRRCTVRGEYLAWYAEDITFEQCRLIGTQPLCYGKNIRLIDCTMEGCDLAFEYTDVRADVRGRIDSVKNPRSGRIVADAIGEVITEGAVMDTACEIVIRK